MKLIIFDLDGTLLDTTGDIAAAANHALTENGFPTHDKETIKSFVGNGILKLLERALPEGEKSEENVQKLKASFVPYYDANGTTYSRPFSGMIELLDYAQDKGIAIAVASNKYQAATTPLVAHYFPNARFVAVLGQRDEVPVKPDPTIVHEICAIAGVDKNDVLYVGDSLVDMQTAKNAGVTVVGVSWGCTSRAKLETASPNYLVDTAEEIQTIISM